MYNAKRESMKDYQYFFSQYSELFQDKFALPNFHDTLNFIIQVQWFPSQHLIIALKLFILSEVFRWWGKAFHIFGS